MYINIQQNPVSRSVKNVHTNLFAKNCRLHKFSTTNSNLKKINIPDIHHPKTYMYTNFQHKRVSRSVKTAHTNLFANIRKMHKFATCN